jgi:hypothetical protein
MDDKTRRKAIAIAAVVVLAIIVIALIVWAIRSDKSSFTSEGYYPYRFWYQYHPWYGRRRHYGYGLPLHTAGPFSKYYWYYRYPYHTYGSSHNPYSTW